MFERFDHDARRALVRAAEREAAELGSSTIQAEHLLLALAGDPSTATGALLAAEGLDHAGVLQALERETERSLAAVGVGLADVLPPVPATPARRRRPFGASAKSALHRAVMAAVAREDRRITRPHLLLGLLRADRGTVPRALAAAGVDRGALAAGTERLLG